jgi:hypothetical protein
MKRKSNWVLLALHSGCHDEFKIDSWSETDLLMLKPGSPTMDYVSHPSGKCVSSSPVPASCSHLYLTTIIDSRNQWLMFVSSHFPLELMPSLIPSEDTQEPSKISTSSALSSSTSSHQNLCTFNPSLLRNIQALLFSSLNL